MTTAGPNYISGITTATSPTDVVNKEYIDNKFGSALPSQTGNAGEFLTTTDGISVSWDYVSNYQEYTTVGTYTFTVPAQANLLYIEATGGGGGGSTGATGPTLAKSGFAWTLRTSGFGATSISNLATNNSTYIASGNSGTLISSTDTVTWTLRTTGFGTTNINSSTYFNNEYLIGGRSNDISWILRTSGFGNSNIAVINYSGTLFVAGGYSGRLTSSTDSINWIVRTIAPVGSGVGSLTFGNGFYVIGSSGTTASIQASTDTITWITRTSTNPAGASQALGLGFGNGIYFVLDSWPQIRTSTDTINWTLRTGGSLAGSGTGFAYGASATNAPYVFSSSGGKIITSTNVIVWTLRTSATSENLNGIIYDGTTYIAVGTNRLLEISTDGIIWTLRTSGVNTNLFSISYNSNLYVATGSTGTNITSTDTITWALRTSGFGNVNSSTFGNNIWVIGADSGGLATSTQAILSSFGVGALLRASTDAVSWTTRTTNTTNSQAITLLTSAGSYSFAHGTNYLGEYDFLNVSTDNITWQLRTSGFGRSAINTFVYDNSFYIAGGNGGVLNFSTDTITWSLRTSGTSSYINNLEYLNSIYLYSTPTVNGPYTTSSIPNTLLGAASLTSSAIPTVGTNDQGYWFLSLPWSIIYNGTSYSGLYVDPNSEITFGGITYQTPYTTALSATFPPNDKIMIQATDNSCQRIYYGTEGSAPNRTYRIRFEGTAATTGTLGAPNMVWEVVFYENNISQIDIQVGTMSRSGAVNGAYSSSSLLITGNIGTANSGTRLTWPIYSPSLFSSTNGISWTSRTSGFGTTGINTLSYSSTANNFIAAGDFGTLSTSTDGIVWRLNTSNTTTNLLTSVQVNNNYYVAGASGTLARASAQLSGTGGSGASYTSWYIPDSIISSSITINVGAGGTGATTENTSGSAGAGTTISWTGPGGTYNLTSNGGGTGGVAGIAQTSITSYFYTTAGLAGAASTTGVGLTAAAQTNQFQPTAGGSGAGINSSSGGAGGTISFYGNTAFSAGGDSSGSNGTTGIAVTSLPYGQGGGGGGAGTSSAGSGGNGIRGAGGGGGAVISSAFGNGGNGGDGYVRITWW